MDARIVQALLSDEMLKTAEDAEAAGRIAARAYADEWQRLETLFKGAASKKEEGDEEAEEDDEDEASEEKAEESEKKGSEEGEEDDGDPVSPEDLAWLVENLGI